MAAQHESPNLSERSANHSVPVRVARLLDRALFFVTLALIPLSALPRGILRSQWEAAFEGVVFALVGLWIIDGLLTETWQVRGRRLLVPLFALIVFAFLQTLRFGQRPISADPYETRLFAFKLLALTLTLGLLLRYTLTRRRLCALIYVVIGVSVASAIFGFIREMSQRDAIAVVSQLEQSRDYAQFVNRNHFAFLMEMSLGMVLGLLAGGGIRRERLFFYCAAIVPIWTTLVLSNSRGGILSMIGQLIFIAFLFTVVRPHQESTQHHRDSYGWLLRISRQLVTRLVLVACLIMVVTVGIVWVGGDSLVSRLEIVTEEMTPGGADNREGQRRTEIWRATWHLIKANPLTGVGFGGYGTAVTKYHDASGEITPQQAHNDYLELLASGGLFGLALAAWFVIRFLGAAREQLRSTDSFRRAASFGALTGIIGVAIHSLIDFGLHVTLNALVFVALVVIAVARQDEDVARETFAKS